MRLLSRKKPLSPPPTPPLFLIPELAEKILLNVPAIDVLTKCRGVCKAWRDLIDNTSPDLKYWSTSGLKRPNLDATTVKPSRVHSRVTPDRDRHPQLLTPIAVEIISIFWKRLAKGGITVATPQRPRRERLAQAVSRRPKRSKRRRHSSSSSMNNFQECLLAVTVIFIILPLSTVAKGISSIRKKVGKVGRKKRAVTSLGKKLIKEFTPVWQKVQIFQSHEPEFRGVLIAAGTNWKHDRIDAWDNTLSLPKEFTNISDAANALMTPLIEAIYSGKLLFIDLSGPTASGTMDPPIAGIDLTYDFDVLGTRINRFDGEAKESLIFEALQPFDVSYKFTRILEDEGVSWGVSSNTLLRAN
ncbi:hypothetical protein TWF718_003848 [Orbilia javanica]|uniref:F-box domain-containing protein n=1 Tax=Orbilia javanica TaxID=47235 RepID=A0AAN8RKI8_9PEZI